MTTNTIRGSRARWVQAAVAATGAMHLFASLGLLFAPQWFLTNIGQFPPFNRHYMGDAGAFLFGLAVALLIAARDPARHRGLLLAAAIGGLVHAGNHLYDDWTGGTSLAHQLTDLLPNVMTGLLPAWAWWETKR